MANRLKPDLRLAAVVAGAGLFLGGSFSNSSDARSAKCDYCTMYMQSNFAGTLMSQFSPTAAKMKADKLGITIVAKAPSWSAILYNESNKSFLELPYAEWKDKLSLSHFSGHKKINPKDVQSVRTGKTIDILGYKANEVLIKHKAAPGQQGVEYTAYVVPQVTPPRQFSELLHSLAQVPTDKGIPFRVNQKKRDGNIATLLDTYKVDMKPVPKEAFDVPKGLKRVHDEMELMIDESDMDFMGTSTSTAKPGAKPTVKPGSIK